MSRYKGEASSAEPTARNICAVLGEVKLVVDDLRDSIRFYRHFGLDFTVVNKHATADLPNGIRLELDALEIVPSWNPRWRRILGSSVILGFELPSGNAVDEMFSTLIAAGYTEQLEPGLAPWGRRIAVVADPDGNPVTFMGPPPSKG